MVNCIRFNRLLTVFPGMLIFQLPFCKLGKSSMERPIFSSLFLFQSFLAAFGQFMNIGSSVAPFIGSLGFFTAMSLDTALAYMNDTLHLDDRELPLWAYPIAMLLPLSCGVQLLSAALVVFVPLVSLLYLFGSHLNVLSADRPHGRGCTGRIHHRLNHSHRRGVLRLLCACARPPLWTTSTSTCYRSYPSGSRCGHGVLLRSRYL